MTIGSTLGGVSAPGMFVCAVVVVAVGDGVALPAPVFALWR